MYALLYGKGSLLHYVSELVVADKDPQIETSFDMKDTFSKSTTF